MYLLLTSYHPTSCYYDTKASKFNDQVSHMISVIPEGNAPIIRSDHNASIGTRANEASCDNDLSVSLLGPHGNPKRNARGNLIIG